MSDMSPHSVPDQVILVVDDNPATRYSTVRVLQVAGFSTREAATGAEALALADSSLAALILDVHLPDIDGFDVCRSLRNRDDTARLPVIHLSAAYVRDQDKLRGLRSGADAYMTHPAEPALLVATVQALVRARTAEDALRRSESRFKAIYDQAPTGICLVDASGRFVEVNPSMLVLLKREARAVIGQRVIDLAPATWVERIELYLDESRHGVWRGEFPLVDAGGHFVHLEWSLSTHVEPGLRLAIATDISERVLLSLQREELLDREQAARATAERVSRSKDEFIAVLSHELRTPLNAILNWTHVLKRAGPAANQVRGLDAIERNAKIQTRLISDILDVSRMDMGKLRLELETVDVAEVVSSAVIALEKAFEEKAIEVSLSLEEGLGPMAVDPARFQQILWNLLTNAIKFSTPASIVRVALARTDTGLRLTVQDQGQGIKPEFLPYLFDRFTQSDSGTNRYHGGLGLGLSIVKHLAELHGGTIWATSAGPGLGATFIATIAAGTADADGTLVTPGRTDEDKARLEPAWAASLDGPTVLAVEDDAEAREMLQIILSDRGARVLTASSYGTGLRCLADSSPDVLVSDIGMPGRDGYDLIREVRRREGGGARLPAIALTAFTREQDREMALAAGFDGHCAKPLRPNELIARILELTAGGKDAAASAGV